MYMCVCVCRHLRIINLYIFMDLYILILKKPKKSRKNKIKRIN